MAAFRMSCGRQGTVHRLQRMAARQDRSFARITRIGAFRLQPAAVLDPLAAARRGGVPAVRTRGHLADRVVAARAGCADGQVPAGRAAAGGLPRDERDMGEFIAGLWSPTCSRPSRRCSRRRAGRSDAASARARLGAARAERRLGDRRRQPARQVTPTRRPPGSCSARIRSRRWTRRWATSCRPEVTQRLLACVGRGQALTAETSSWILTLSETSRLPEPRAALNVIPKSLRSICPAAETPTRSLP